MRDNNNYTRRASDLTNSGGQPTLTDVWKLLIEVRESLDDVIRQQEAHTSAFIKDDLDRPDFDGHRKSHIKMIKSDEIVREYKTDATKKIIELLVIYAVGVLSSGVLSKFGIL